MCGICCNAVAAILLENNLHFDNNILQLLPQYISNPCVTGFMMEQAILSSIALNGLNITPELNYLMDMLLFQDNIPSFDTTKDGPMLYILKSFNFQSINGIIV
jgi:hypothetical protein